MKISVIGGGPGGLYFSILTKKRLPNVQIDVYEQNNPEDAFGFGVVFSDETLSEFLSYDQKSYDLIRDSFAYWDDIIVARNGENVRIEGNGFCGCSRKTLLKLLQQRCREEGINLHFKTRVDDLSQFADSDIILAADGIGSSIRGSLENEFGTKITMKTNRFLWCGSNKPLDAFTYFFRETPYGTFVAHTYQYEEGMSTWIFECSDETWHNAGFEVTNEEKSIKLLEELFKEELDGYLLISNKSHWRQFPHVENKNWFHKNIVLLGDAKATAHYSIGSGTKLAMDCAIGLSDAVVAHPDNVQKAFELYDEKRRTPVEMIQYAALVSLDWFENMDRHMKLDFDSFSFSVMSRSKKITIENQARRDKKYSDRVIQAFNKNVGSENLNQSPAFTPFNIGNLKLENRIVMSSMGQYCAEGGVPNPWHFQHYTSRAVGGTGLIITELTAISEAGKYTDACLGIWNDEQVAEWKKINDFIHQNTSTKTAVQIGHAGRKAGTDPKNLSKNLNNKEVYSASATAFKEGFPTPKEMTRADMDLVKNDFVNAAKNAVKAGFNALEIQMHNGFLLATFLSPLTNHRTDEYGGEIANRGKFPLEVLEAVQEAVGKDFPVIVKLSVTDWYPNGISKADVEFFCNELKKRGVPLLNINTGNTVAGQNPVYGRMWQSPYSEWIRNTIDIPTITTGGIEDIDQVNTILLNRRADLVALGRMMLVKPYFAMEAKAYENYKAENLGEAQVPNAYFAGVQMLYKKAQKDRTEFEKMKQQLKPVSHSRK